VFAAGIDVFEEEPAMGNKLFDLENVFVTPHIGANTVEVQEGAILALDNTHRDWCFTDCRTVGLGRAVMDRRAGNQEISSAGANPRRMVFSAIVRGIINCKR